MTACAAAVPPVFMPHNAQSFSAHFLHKGERLANDNCWKIILTSSWTGLNAARRIDTIELGLENNLGKDECRGAGGAEIIWGPGAGAENKFK